MNRKSVFITQTNCITPIGFDVDSNWDAILKGKSGIQLHQNTGNLDNYYASILSTSQLNEQFSKTVFPFSVADEQFTKLEKMMLLALLPLVSNNKITTKTAFIFSTTKGNISSLKVSTTTIKEVQFATLAKKISALFGFTTEPLVISNACVSGVLAIAVAKRMIQAEVYDDAFVVAGDEVSEFVLSGFNSFQAMSEWPCKPYDKDRNGVSLGEATAAVYITSDATKIKSGAIKICGDGAINDANHISGPSRTGEGLYRSIQSALSEASIDNNKIDYISAHGTATLYNDEMEAIALNRLHLQNIPVNSLKGFYGHTLGASGLLESVIAIESARRNQLIASKGYDNNGVTEPIAVVKENKACEINYFLKTASGFGGCNTAIVFEKIK